MKSISALFVAGLSLAVPFAVHADAGDRQLESLFAQQDALAVRAAARTATGDKMAPLAASTGQSYPGTVWDFESQVRSSTADKAKAAPAMRDKPMAVIGVDSVYHGA